MCKPNLAPSMSSCLHAQLNNNEGSGLPRGAISTVGTYLGCQVPQLLSRGASARTIVCRYMIEGVGRARGSFSALGDAHLLPFVIVQALVEHAQRPLRDHPPLT